MITTSKRVLKVDCRTGEILATYRSRVEACRDTGVSESCLSSACSGRFATAGGFIWVNDTKEGRASIPNRIKMAEQATMRRGGPIRVKYIGPDGTTMEFASATEASRVTGTNPSAICYTCRGVIKHRRNGEHWEYAEVGE